MGIRERGYHSSPAEIYPFIDLSVEESIQDLRSDSEYNNAVLTSLYQEKRSSRPVLSGRFVDKAYTTGLFQGLSFVSSIGKEDDPDAVALKSAWEGIVIVSHLPILAEMTLVEGLDRDSKFLEALGIPIGVQRGEKECFEFLKAAAKRLRDDHTGFSLVDGFCDGSIPDPNKAGHKVPQAFEAGADFARRIYKEIYPFTERFQPPQAKGV